MPFFRFRGGDNGVSKDERRAQMLRAEQTVAALERGDIPQYVKERILEQKQGEYPWTSDLSVNEWLLLQQYNLQPVGMVMGTSIYHIGYSAASFSGTWGSGFIPTIEDALQSGRNLALQRMKQEAQLLGAHAVVGVRLKTRMPDVNSHETEFTAFGTAVVLEGQKAPAEPLLCTVSASDFLKLIQAGSVPITLGLGVAAYYQYSSRQDQWQSRSWQNQEMTRYTESVYETRHRAISHLRNQIHEVGGSGVLAHDTSLHVYEREVERGENDKRIDHILEFVSLGTIVSTVPMSERPSIESVLSLRTISKTKANGNRRS